MQSTSLIVGASAVGYKSESFPSSISPLLLYGMNVNTRCFQTTPLDGYTKLLTFIKTIKQKGKRHD